MRGWKRLQNINAVSGKLREAQFRPSAACREWPFGGNHNRDLSQKPTLALTHDWLFNRLRKVPPDPATSEFRILFWKILRDLRTCDLTSSSDPRDPLPRRLCPSYEGTGRSW